MLRPVMYIIICIGLIASCSKKSKMGGDSQTIPQIPPPPVPEQGDAEADNDKDQEAAEKPDPSYSLSISVDESRFEDRNLEEMKYTITYGEQSISKPLEFDEEGKLVVRFNNLTKGQKNFIKMEFLEKDKVVLYGIQPAFKITKTTTKLNIRNCRIISATWDGKEDEGDCNWTIE